MGLEFLRPELLWALPAMALAWAIHRLLRRPDYVATTTLRWLQPLSGRPSPLRRLPVLLLVLSMVLIVLAMMDPVLPLSEREVKSQGLDIVIVLDLSQSMQELMEEPVPEAEPAYSGGRRPRELQDMSMIQAGKTRLDTTREALADFIGRREEDRIGLVVFSNRAYVVSPLTLDYDYLRHYLDMVDGQILRGENMTAIGDGMALAGTLLDRQAGDGTRGRVVAVFTDGEHNFGADPLEVLPRLDASGARVHVVGVDLEQKILENEAVQRLIEAVREHGGRYFDAGTEADLLAVTGEIDAMEKGRLVSREYVRQTPVFGWFGAAAASVFLLAFMLRSFPYFSEFT